MLDNVSPRLSLRDESERKLTLRQRALCMERPIKSLNDMESDLEITLGQMDGTGSCGSFKAVAKYPLIAQFDPGRNNFYQGNWMIGGSTRAYLSLSSPYIYGCPGFPPLMRRYNPAACKEDYVRIKTETGKWVTLELEELKKTAIEVNPYRMRMIMFDKPLHMAFLIGEFNYRIGTAEVRVNGLYKEGISK